MTNNKRTPLHTPTIEDVNSNGSIIYGKCCRRSKNRFNIQQVYSKEKLVESIYSGDIYLIILQSAPLLSTFCSHPSKEPGYNMGFIANLGNFKTSS